MNKNLMVLLVAGLFANNAFGIVAGRVSVINDKSNPSDIWVTYFNSVSKSAFQIMGFKYKCSGKCPYIRVQVGENYTPSITDFAKVTQHAFRVRAYICQSGKVVGYDSDDYEASTDEVRVKVIPQGNSAPKFVFTEEGDSYDVSVTAKSGKNK